MNCFGTIASRITPILLCVLCGCASRVTAAPADAAVDAAEVLDASEDVEDRTDVVATDAGFPEPVPPRPLRLLAAGARHTCAIRAGGRVWCWGINFDGQLGVAGPQSPNPDLLPIAVPDLEDAVELSAGTSFTCALRRSGRVVCWGNNDHGQRGLGFIGPGTSSGPDAEVSGLDDAVSIESGGDFSCARRAGGELVCWGRNQSGQCGRSGPDVLATPSEVNPVGVVEATVGYAHACVRVRTGEVLCWGSNSAGQLGADPGVTGSSRSNLRSWAGSRGSRRCGVWGIRVARAQRMARPAAGVGTTSDNSGTGRSWIAGRPASSLSRVGSSRLSRGRVTRAGELTRAACYVGVDRTTVRPVERHAICSFPPGSMDSRT